MNARQHAVSVPLRDGEQLDHVPQLARVPEVLRRQRADALGRDRLGGHVRAEGETGHDRDLEGRIVPVDVVRRVGLGVAKRLRLCERVLEALAALRHVRQDEVRRAVMIARMATTRFAGRSRSSGAMTGMPPPTLASKRSAALFARARVEQLRTGLRDQLLVRRDHVLAPASARRT